MRKSIVVIIVLCGLLIGCKPEDTKRADLWPRTVEPRLTEPTRWEACRKAVSPERAVAAPAQCAAVPIGRAEPCDEFFDRTEAAHAIAFQPACTDGAVAALERFARTDPEAMNDLAAAYYVRAQRNDTPVDLLKAADAAEHALASAPASNAARFNVALTQEALGLSDDALASWNRVLQADDAPWAAEAREHRHQIARGRSVDAALVWARNREQLPAALRSGDRAAMARLIAPFPSTAERYFEDELLPQWAAVPVSENLSAVQTFASELSRIGHDRFFADVAQAIDAAQETPQALAALRDGHRAFGEGRVAVSSFGLEASVDPFTHASKGLAAGGSPLHLLAELNLAVPISYRKDGMAEALALLDPIGREADKRHYGHLAGRVHAMRSFLLFQQSRYLETLAELDAAIVEYSRVGDAENIFELRNRRIGYARTIGQREEAWAAAFQNMRSISHIVRPQERHFLLGETAASALSLGYPRIALAYQNGAIRLIQKELRTAPPERLDRIIALQMNLAIALRGRAGIELHLGSEALAQTDLDEAIRLTREKPERTDAGIRRVLLARVAEVRGQALLPMNPAGAIAAFSEGLSLASVDEFRTFRASLFAQRAAAQRRLGRTTEAGRDVLNALHELHAEESQILQSRKLGEGENVWRSYFSRFQATYELLIRQLIDEHHDERALAYAERARAFELLNLVEKLRTTPREFHDLVAQAESAPARAIQAWLPPGTFVLEYTVLDDRTYTWIISRDRFARMTQTVRRADVERWTAALQDAVRRRNARDFDAGLYAPFDALVAAPLAAIAGMPGGAAPRLVFVPDGAMRGMPLSALRNARTKRYLIQDAPLSIAGSAMLYVYSLLRDRALEPSPPSALLIGNPAFNKRLAIARGLSDLPHAEDEVVLIKALYGPRVEKRVRDKATVPEFLSLARDRTVIHIAAHAIANAEVPSRSALLLAPSAQHSGVLDAEELLTRLSVEQTRLVVLGTCSSGGGLPVGPEGVAPLVRPLIASGVPAVVGSLWDVGDATAETVLVSFHRHYRQGSDAAAALRAAQVELLENKKNPGLRSVLAWAPFQVIGHASSPSAPAPQPKGEPP